LIQSKFEEFKQESSTVDFNSVESLISFLDKGDYPQSLKFGLECAFVDYLSRLAGKSVQQYLSVNTVSSVKTSFSIPIMEESLVADFIRDHHLDRFHVLKLKVNKENALSLTELVLKHFTGLVRVDANESFDHHEEVLHYLNSLSDVSRLEFLEQPLKASAHEEQLLLKSKTKVILIADESVTSESVTDFYQERFDGINIKLMKAGGYVKALKQLRQAKVLGLKVMLGCMVESSLGISAALNIASGFDYFDLDGFLLLKEDPYHILTEENGKVFYSFIQ